MYKIEGYDAKNEIEYTYDLESGKLKEIND